MSEDKRPKVEEESSAQGRKFERRSCRLRLRCRRVKSVGLYDSTEKYIEGMARNQSKGGLLLETPIYFPVGAKLEVSFKSPDDKQSFLGVVTVRWIKRAVDGFQLGVATDKLDSF